MAYSRWGDSKWYIYWSAYSEEEDKGMQMLTLHLAKTPKQVSITYGFIVDCRDDVVDYIKGAWNLDELPDLDVLEECLDKFIADVDEEFTERLDS